jgi:hypothetical protein
MYSADLLEKDHLGIHDGIPALGRIILDQIRRQKKHSNVLIS